MNITEIKERLIKKYHEGKGFNEGGLSIVNNKEWKGLLVGVFLNLMVGLDPKTFEVVKTKF